MMYDLCHGKSVLYSFHLWSQSGLQHLKKIVMGSSADLVCICMKYALGCSHLGHVSCLVYIWCDKDIPSINPSKLIDATTVSPSVVSTFSHAAAPPSTSSTSFSRGYLHDETWTGENSTHFTTVTTGREIIWIPFYQYSGHRGRCCRQIWNSGVPPPPPRD